MDFIDAALAKVSSHVEAVVVRIPAVLLSRGFFIGAALFLYVGWKVFRQSIVARYTGLVDVEYLDAPRPGPKLVGTVVIAGGSISGLLAARVCSKHYEKVIMVESEDVTDPTRVRSFIMQYQQLHTFLAFFTRCVVGLFPDFKERVRAYGGRTGDFVFPFWLGERLRIDPEDYDTETLFISRQGMETVLRRAVTETCPNVEVWSKSSVTGMELDAKKEKVACALVRKGGADSIVQVPCALLLDCTGPAIGSRRWLPKVGYVAPEKITYDPGVVYASCIFDLANLPNREKLDPNVKPSDGYIYGCRPAVGKSRTSGYISRIENDTVLVCAATWNGDEGLPRKISELPEYWEGLPHWPEHSRLIKALCESQPDTVLRVVRPPPCHRIGWDAVKTPSNFCPIGDTVQKLNAQYGQGTCQAALMVTTLNKMLLDTKGSAIGKDFSKDYIKRIFGRITYMWDSSRLTDYGWGATVPAPNESLEQGGFERWVQERVIEAMTFDPMVTRHVYSGSAQGLNHHLLEVLNFRLLFWIARLSIFGLPSKDPVYRKPQIVWKE